tara:strand:- start:789 stop:1175 length:387 start_codon:yes stop_codon:yes gene_type:complete
MEEENDKNNFRDEIYSNAVRAGKRTYFFDVKSTRGGDYYLTITESKKRFQQDGSFHFEKHKLFLYKEDFEKFNDGFTDVISKIQELNEEAGNVTNEDSNQDQPEDNSDSNNNESSDNNNFKEVDFDDL